MMEKRDGGASDAAAEILAAFATSAFHLSEAAGRAAKHVIFDSVAVAVTAIPHHAAATARDFAWRYRAQSGANTILGASFKSDLETAAFVNGVLMRCHDFNDLYIGTKSGGHPSDIVLGVLGAAQAFGRSGGEALTALAVGYETMLSLFDLVPLERQGFDYTNVTLIGAACAIGRLMGLDPGQMKQALCIAATSHLSTNEIESGDLNKTGDLTLWKRFHGGEAVRHAVWSCQLASVGVEGALRAFTGACGFFMHLGAGDVEGELRGRLQPATALTRIGHSVMKRWPVGSRAQSAIHAALEARRQIAGAEEIETARVLTNESAYDHLVRIREHAWRPFSRETADHSLPYVVGQALLDGRVGTDSFDPETVNDLNRLDFLKKITIEIDSSGLSKKEQADQGYPTKIVLRTKNGREIAAEGGAPPGHVMHPLSRQDLEEKLREGLAACGWSARFHSLSEALWSIDAEKGVDHIFAHLSTKPEDKQRCS